MRNIVTHFSISDMQWFFTQLIFLRVVACFKELAENFWMMLPTGNGHRGGVRSMTVLAKKLIETLKGILILYY